MTITDETSRSARPQSGIIVKKYEAPKLEEMGSVADVTRGEGLAGDADSFWIFTWGS